ncbi:MAG TPA: outer membrane beta-barrel protein [Gemmatimonadaceae bacterium]|nr:outer membrane beta-barrel protein [Gemmatimonadaceae bacterium]
MLAVVAALLAMLPARSRAQSTVIDRLGLDKLQIQSLSASIGRVDPSQVEPATLYALTADYGQIAPGWRVVFGFSYWQSRFRDAVVQQFVDSLQKSVSDSSAHIEPSPVHVYDVTIGADVRYSPYTGAVQPFGGVGFAAHVINAEGKLINGTFVERALDDVAAGFYLDAGVALKLLKHVGVEGSVRGDLLSGFRSTQVRAGATYYFGHVRGTNTGGGDTSR